MAVIVFLVGICLAVHRLAPFVPWVVGILNRDGHRTARHVQLGQREPGPPVRTGRRLWTDALPVGVFTKPRCWEQVIAAWLRQTIQHRRAVLTHRLCGTHPDGRRLSDVPASTERTTQRNTRALANDLGRLCRNFYLKVLQIC